MSTGTAWIEAHAQDLNGWGPVVAAARKSQVVALGENTRESAEIDRHRVELVKTLVEDAEYRVIVIPDSANVAERMDDYALGRRSDLRDVVLSGWLPNRTEATAKLLGWAREFNEAHPDAPVRFVGNGPRETEPEDYDRVVALAERLDPAAVESLRERYDVVRTAHDVNEHIQTHQGIHPGRPFVELAGEALDLVRALPEGEGKAEAVGLADDIRGFHANSVAAMPDFGEISKGIAVRIIDAHERFGQKIVYFDGFALTGILSDVEVAVNPGKPFGSAGRLLRDRFGSGYVSVLLVFGHGVIRGGEVVIPEPGNGYVEKTLLDSGADEVLLPLGDGWPDGPVKLRIIAGVYSPDEDEQHGIDVPSLRQAADFLGFVRTITESPQL